LFFDFTFCVLRSALFTFHFSLFTFHFSLSLFTFHFSLFTFHFSVLIFDFWFLIFVIWPFSVHFECIIAFVSIFSFPVRWESEPRCLSWNWERMSKSMNVSNSNFDRSIRWWLPEIYRFDHDTFPKLPTKPA
jgi:hypothetical protein